MATTRSLSTTSTLKRITRRLPRSNASPVSQSHLFASPAFPLPTHLWQRRRGSHSFTTNSSNRSLSWMQLGERGINLEHVFRRARIGIRDLIYPARTGRSRRINHCLVRQNLRRRDTRTQTHRFSNRVPNFALPGSPFLTAAMLPKNSLWQVAQYPKCDCCHANVPGHNRP